MEFKMSHTCIAVLDLARSLEFYEKALGLTEKRRIEPTGGNFTLVFLGNDTTEQRLELTWMKERVEPYDLGDNEVHIGFLVEDFAAAHQLHENMGCICYENESMGIYFIEDPDGYWMEVIPVRH